LLSLSTHLSIEGCRGSAGCQQCKFSPTESPWAAESPGIVQGPVRKGDIIVELAVKLARCGPHLRGRSSRCTVARQRLEESSHARTQRNSAMSISLRPPISTVVKKKSAAIRVITDACGSLQRVSNIMIGPSAKVHIPQEWGLLASTTRTFNSLQVRKMPSYRLASCIAFARSFGGNSGSTPTDTLAGFLGDLPQ